MSSSITSDINSHIASRGGSYPAWYIGIAARPRERLFSDHGVSEQHGAWIYRDAGSEAAARLIEKHFIALGCRGGDGGGGVATKYVYAFRMN